MYGTIAHFRLKPGMEEQLTERIHEGKRKVQAGHAPGFVFEHVYRLDRDPAEYVLVVAFASKVAYVAHANQPGQHDFYLAFRELLDGDPAWHDGEIVHTI